MKLPRNFFKPLAVGAPAPVRELPVRLERMIHFVPPHIEKVRAKVPELIDQVDIVLGNLEDAIPADAKDAARQRFHRDGKCLRLRLGRIVDARQRAQLAMDPRRSLSDRLARRQQSRCDHAAQSRGRMGHPLSRPATRAARGQAQRQPADPHPRHPGNRRRRQQCRGDRRGIAAYAWDQPRPCRSRRIARHEDDARRWRTS